MRARQPVTEVPDVVGFDAEDACTMIKRAGLVPVGPEETNAPQDGVVTAQRPIGHAGAEKGSSVVVWAHGGKRSAEELVPAGPVESGDMDHS